MSGTEQSSSIPSQVSRLLDTNDAGPNLPIPSNVMHPGGTEPAMFTQWINSPDPAIVYLTAKPAYPLPRLPGIHPNNLPLYPFSFAMVISGPPHHLLPIKWLLCCLRLSKISVHVYYFAHLHHRTGTFTNLCSRLTSHSLIESQSSPKIKLGNYGQSHHHLIALALNRLGIYHLHPLQNRKHLENFATFHFLAFSSAYSFRIFCCLCVSAKTWSSANNLSFVHLAFVSV